MKSILLYLCLLFSTSSFGCWGYANQNITVAQDTVQVIQTAVFCLGSGSSCPPLNNYDFQVNGATVIVDFYYDISGAWPTNFCQRIDTIREFLNNGTYTLIINSFNIDFDSTYLKESNTTSSITVSIEPIEKQDFNVSYDPFERQFQIFKNDKYTGHTLIIYNLQGKEILRQQLGNSNTESIPTTIDTGVYFYTVSNSGIKPERVRIRAEH